MSGDAADAATLMRHGAWPVDTEERHRDALVPGDLVLLYLGAPHSQFVGRAELASAADESGVSLTRVEHWDPPVPMSAVLPRIDPTDKAKGEFDTGVVRITAGEYATALAVAAERTTYPIVREKWRNPSLHGPEQFLGGALAAGWEPGEIPHGAVFVFDHRVWLHLEQRPDVVDAPELAPGNARVFRVGRVIVSCLSPGAAAMVTQMQNLAYLGTRRFAVVGTAGSISADVLPGTTVIPDRAVRDDGISQHYLPLARYAAPSSLLTERLRRSLPDAIAGTTWTVPVPYRLTARELEVHSAAGVVAVEMEVASLFAVAEAIGVEAAAVLVISDVTTPREHIEDWAATTEPLLHALDVTVHALAD